jgi:hypothetical protein
MKIDQCLFGYEDGHRLLASSMSLGEQTSLLTQLSDLAPGTIFGASDGYWTGLPLPHIGRYALMRTWLAPEMPRPGCVWTHVMLVDPVFLEEAPDLAILQRVARRPQRPDDRAIYREPLEVSFEAVGPAPIRNLSQGESLHKLLVSLYASGGAVVSVADPGELDPVLFAVWSQQWPRLRRNFRFQTATSRDPHPAGGTRFDVVLQLRDDVTSTHPVDWPWVKAATADVVEGGRGGLRSFLWRYGQDVRRQRGSFRPLCEIKLLHDDPGDDAGPRLLRLVTESFSQLEDASTLKQDVVDGLVVPDAQLDVLWFVLANDGGNVMPPPSPAGIGRIGRLWRERPDELLPLAQHTADADDPLRRSVFGAIAAAVPIADFWHLTASYPRVRECIVRTRPELLRSEQVLTLDNLSLVSLVAQLPPDASVAADLIPRLLSRDDARLAEVTTERFPQAVAIRVITAVGAGTTGVGNAWARELVRRPSALLDPVVMGHVNHTSQLYGLADSLGWLTPQVIGAGTEPWIAALDDIDSDLPDDKRDTLNSFLIALALVSGSDGGRRILEKFFDAVHGQILKSRLPWRACDILAPILPDVGWIKEWDFGLRLRLAVARSYVDNRFDPASFARLSKSRKTRVMLAAAAAAVPDGKNLARAVDAV